MFAPALLALLAAALAPPLARADVVAEAGHRTGLSDGAGNRVEVDPVPGGRLRVSGDRNEVLYAPIAPGPVLAMEGTDNSVAAGGDGAASAVLAPPVPLEPPPPATVPPPARADLGTMVVRGDAVSRTIDCTGRNVLIEGNESSFTLRGGCRSVTVLGHADTVLAELQPGARIAIGGDAVTLRYRLTGGGPAPIISVTGSNSRALQVSSAAP
ncbi:MAG: hypothetical protein M0Z28_04860 [Rhodospirillales bacterium]|nr:hypothetical protein [Rhodospirillales bacterium]